MLAIDANVFLEVILKQERSQECKDFLKRVLSGDTPSMLSEFNLDSIMISMGRNKIDGKTMRWFLATLRSYKGLRLHPCSLNDRIRATKWMDEYGLDYEDSLTLQCALSGECEGLVTLDSEFAKVKGIKKLEPKQAMMI